MDRIKPFPEVRSPQLATHSLLRLMMLSSLLLGGCVSESPDPYAPDLVDRSMRGDLELRLQGVAGLLNALDLRVYRPDGSEIATGVIPVPAGQDTASSTLVLPAGLGYTMTLAGRSNTGSQCTGTAIFNVVAGQGNDVQATLTCDAPNKSSGSNNGSVNVEVNIDAGQVGVCPDISFISALPKKMNVGGRIKLRSAATHAAAQFRWTASSGRFSNAQISDPDFICTEVGPAKLRLTVGISPGCEDHYELELDCLATADDGADSGSEGDTGNESDSGSQGTPDDGTSSDEAPGTGAGSDAPVRRIRFAPTVAGEDFACRRPYQGLGSTGVDGTVSDFRFYVHNVRLLTPEGTEVPFVLDDRAEWQGSGVGLIDFEGGPDAGCYGGSKGRNTELTGLAPQGNYTGVRFSIGVPEALNHADPSTLKAPLTAGGMAWSWLAGFKFLKFELGPAVLHVGSTSCTRTPSKVIKCKKQNRPEIELLNFDPHTQVIQTDIAAAFQSSDLAENPSCHATGEACGPLFEQVGLKLEDGTAADSQSVFSVQ